MRRPILTAALLLAPLLAASGPLLATTGALLVDGERPSVDRSMRPFVRPPGNDLTWVFLPHHLRIAADVARLGRPAAWDPGGFCGRPRVGNPQSGLFYPPVWPTWLVLPRWPAALVWLTIAHLFWGGLGTYLLGIDVKLTYVSAILAGICFELSPYALSHAYEGHYPHVWAASWYPWAFLAARRLLRGDRTGTVGLPLALSACFLTGHPQEWAYLMVALGGWWSVEMVRRLRSGDRRDVARLTGRIGLILGLHAALTAIEWLPDLRAMAWTLRIDEPGGMGSRPHELRLLDLLRWISPRALGGPADYLGRDNFWETQIALGWVPLVLVAFGLTRSPGRPEILGWSALSGVALVFATGSLLGLPDLLGLLPVLGSFRTPARSLFLASLGAAMLAGFGVEALERNRGGLRRATIRYTGLAVVLGLSVLTWAGVADSKQRLAEAAAAIAHDPAFWFAQVGTGAALVWAASRPDRGRRLATALVVLATVELAWQGAWLWHVAPADRFVGPDPVLAAIARVRPDGRHRVRARDLFFDDLRAVRGGIEKTNLGDYFQIADAADLYSTLYPIFDPPRPNFPDTPDRAAVRQAVLDRLNVGLLVSDRPEPGANWPVVARGTSRGTPFLIYRNPTALPRAYVVPRARPTPPGSGMIDLFPKVPAREAVLMAADPLPAGPRQPFTPADYDASDPDRVVIRVETAAPGLLVVADTWTPGWSARVDGRPAPVLRGNHAQRVIPLDTAGSHRVVLRFRPPGLAAGLALTTVGAIGWILLACSCLRGQQSPFRYRGQWVTMAEAKIDPTKLAPMTLTAQPTTRPLASRFRRLAVLMLATLLGCGERVENRAPVPVSGSIRHKGRPLSTGRILLVPESGAPAVSGIGTDGSFRLKTGDRDGVPPGTYRVALVATEETEEPEPSLRSTIPEQYRDPDTSGVVVEVPPGGLKDYVLDLP